MSKLKIHPQADEGRIVHVTPESAKWTYVGFDLWKLKPGRAAKGGEASSSNFDYAGPFTEFVLTGVLASRAGVGKKLEWDVAGLRCTNAPEAKEWIKRTYRKGWEV